MKRLKMLSIAICIFSVLAYGTYRIYCYSTTDKYGPVIDMEEKELSVSISSGEDALLQGVTASDLKDGDVTDSLVVESVSKFLENNRKIVTYAAFDSNKHVGKATREVVYNDYTSPEFSSKTPFRFPVNSTNFIGDVKAKDCIDGDISDKVKISPGYTVMTDTPGDYKIQIQVANSSGDVEYLPVTLEIYDPTERTVAPNIQLKKYIVYTRLNKKINPKEYLKKVIIGSSEYKVAKDGSLYIDNGSTAGTSVNYSDIEIDDSNVDYGEAGTYEVTYSMTVDKKYKGKTRLIVVVRDEAGEN